MSFVYDTSMHTRRTPTQRTRYYVQSENHNMLHMF